MAINVSSLKNINEARECEDMLRQSLADRAGECDYFWLAEVANSLAAIEAAIKVFSLVELLERNNATTLECIEELTGFLSCGANDESSGRSNDVRRAYFDGVRQATARHLMKLYREANKEFYGEVSY